MHYHTFRVVRHELKIINSENSYIVNRRVVLVLSNTQFSDALSVCVELSDMK